MKIRFLSTLAALAAACANAFAADIPNILWISSEDNSPYLGCYGDPVARTPNIDRLAAEGVRYTNCFSNAAVCAPARQTLISGIYASSIGGQHMRSTVPFPDGVPFFPKHLREAGFYTSNNSKTDYNGGPVSGKAAMSEAWNESSAKAHWRKRPEGQPFFSVFNFTESHESCLFASRWKNRDVKTDPASVSLPAYLPDLPELRLDLARYYDSLEAMDKRVGALLTELEADGLAEDTIVFYFGDHGGCLPRGKSFIYDSGTRVPLIVRVPEKWRRLAPAVAGESSDRLVSFVDFAPTVLSLAGIEAPGYMQGSSFLGEHSGEAREFVHTFRGRRGERYDIVRGVRDAEFLYLRNYTPHLPVMQFNSYAWTQIPGYQAWFDAWKRGDCAPEQAQWFEPKAPEELYRIADDPDNVRNLAADPAFAGTLARLRDENDRHLRAIRDSAFFPEGMTGREFPAYQDDETYPLDELIGLASAVSDRDPTNLPRFQEAMQSANPCVRYWGVTGCVVLGEASAAAGPDLRSCLEDSEPVIQLQAARALAGIGQTEIAIPVIRRFVASKSEVLSLQAVLAIDECELLAADPSLAGVLEEAKGTYAGSVVKHLEAARATSR